MNSSDNNKQEYVLCDTMSPSHFCLIYLFLKIRATRKCKEKLITIEAYDLFI